MKNILLSIDFSKHAYNAALYAAELASHTGARLILFHAYNPLVRSEDDQLNEELMNTERKVQHKLDALARRLQALENISITRLLKPGNVVDETLYVAKKIKADLIVIGVEKTNRFHTPVLDALTSEIIEKTTLPILLVPPKTSFQPFEVVHLTADKADAEHDLVNIKFMNKLMYTFKGVQFIKKQKHAEVAVPQLLNTEVSSKSKLADPNEPQSKEQLLAAVELDELTQNQRMQLMVQAYVNATTVENNLKQHTFRLVEAIPLLLLPPTVL